jgi:hypothetical protein
MESCKPFFEMNSAETIRTAVLSENSDVVDSKKTVFRRNNSAIRKRLADFY